MAAVILAERSSAETKNFVAFSMSAAEVRVKSALSLGKDFRKDDPELFNLGGITRPWAIVIINDSRERDCILVGEREAKTWTITLDDMTVALRSRYNFPDEDPGVTIDPKHLREDLKQHRRPDFRVDLPQDVHFFGGIENTHFGRVCFDADWLLKNISFGRSSLPHLNIKSTFTLASEQWSTGERTVTDVRNWFCPSVNRVNIFPDLVLLEDFQMAVLTEVLYAERDGKRIEDLTHYVDKPSDEFARSLNDTFDNVVQDSDTVDALCGLARLAGLGKGLAASLPASDLQFFLSSYPLIEISTSNEVPTLSVDNPDVGLRMSGGVELSVLTRKLRAGDEKVLRDIVLAARRNSSQGAMTWNFNLDVDKGQLLAVRLPPESREELRKAQFALVQGDLLQKKGQFDAAIPWYTDFLQHNPSAPDGYVDRGVAYSAKGDHDAAMSDFNDAISLDPNCELALLDRGIEFCHDKNQPSVAVRDFDAAIKMDPEFYFAYCARAEAFQRMGQYDKASADIRTAIGLSPGGWEAYAMRGMDYMIRLKDYQLASADFARVIQYGAAPADIYVEQSICHGMLNEDDLAIDDFNHALALDPKTEINYLMKALSHKRRIEDYTRYTTIGSKAAVISDGIAGPPIESAGARVFSADGSRVAYPAGIDENRCGLVVDGTLGPDFDNIGARGYVNGTTFSPDSKRITYLGRRMGKWYVVVDGQLGSGYDLVAGKGSPVFSPDSKRIAFAAKESGKWFVVVDGKRDREFDGIYDGPWFSGNSKHYAYGAKLGQQQIIVVDGQIQQPLPGGIGADTFRFSPDGDSWGFAGNEGQQYSVVIGTRQLGAYSGLYKNPLHFSNDGKHFAFVAAGEKDFVVLDGKPLQKYDNVLNDTLTFNSNGTRLAYVAGREQGPARMVWRGESLVSESPVPPTMYACIDGLTNMEYETVGHEILFSGDGEHAVFVAGVSGGRKCVVLDGVAGPEFDTIREGSLCISYDGENLAYIATSGSAEFVVYNGLSGPVFDKIISPALTFQKYGVIEYLGMSHNRISRHHNVQAD